MKKIVHRCPYCKSDKVIEQKVKDKSNTQKSLEAIGGIAEGYFLGTDGSLTDWISNSFYDPSKQPKFLCRECRKTWNNPNLIDETPLEELEREKDYLKSDLKKGMIKQCVWLVVVGALAVWSFLYCWDNDFIYTQIEDVWLLGEREVEHYNFSWLGVGLIFVIALFLSINAFFSVMDKREKIKQISRMNLEEFRNSKLRP